MGKHNINYLYNFGSLILILITFGELIKNVQCVNEPQPFNDDPTNIKYTRQNFNQEEPYPDDKSSGDLLKTSDLGFWHAFLASLSVILVSELGDKTFFIAAIMAMRHPRLTVFIGAMAALGLMTVLSVIFGQAANFISRVYTYYISTFLFAIFGLKMLKDGYYMSATDAQEEFEEVQSDLRKRDDELLKSLNEDTSLSITTTHDDDNTARASCSVTPTSTLTSHIRQTSPTRQHPRQQQQQPQIFNSHPIQNGDLTNATELRSLNNLTAINRFEREASNVIIVQDPESGVIRKAKAKNATYLFSRILLQAFTMTFVAEWGDRSQLTTIILAAREDPYGIAVGGIFGHSLCTGLAVIGGRFIAQKISVRTVTIVGGVVFILFAFSALFFKPDDE